MYSHNVVFKEECFPLKGGDSSFKDCDEIDFLDELPNINSMDSSQEPINQLTEDCPSSPVIPSSEIADKIISMRIVEGDLETENIINIPINDSSSEPTQKAKYNISSSIDKSNILPHRRQAAHNASSATRATTSALPDPTTYHQAINRPDADEWIGAINQELGALELMGVWEETKLPSHVGLQEENRSGERAHQVQGQSLCTGIQPS